MSTNDTNIKNDTVIKIEGNSDIYYESLEKMEKSVRREDYINATRVMKEIVKAVGKRSEYTKSGTDLRNKEQVYNVVFFTGERGAGKTSVMLTYMEFLKDYYRNTTRDVNVSSEFFDKIIFKNQSNSSKDKEFRDYYMFTGIDYIDASALNEKDDLLGSVLSNMLTKWKKEEWNSNTNSGIVRGNDYEHKKRKLRMCFNEVYERLKDIRSKKDMTEGDSDMFLETLEHLSLSYNLKKSLKELIDTYLDIMVYPNSERNIDKDNHFLVISIDDLDMNISYGFMLLEQIRKYLMIPNVIVLLSGNYEQMEKICCNYYSIQFDKMKDESDKTQYIKRLSREYLDKMIPKQNHVDILTGLKWKFFSQNRIKIEYVPLKEKLPKKDKLSERENVPKNDNLSIEMEGTLCEIVSKCMEKFFGVRFQHDGRCIKYLTPKTMRELISWIMQIYNLEDPTDPNNTNTLEIYERNIKFFKENIFQNLCEEYLKNEQIVVLRSLDDLTINKKVDLVYKQLVSKVLLENGAFSWISPSNVDYEKQSYAVLCLIYFMMELSLLKVQILYGEECKRERAKKNLKQYFSKHGIWGKTEMAMLDMVKGQDSNSEGQADDSNKNRKLKNKAIQINKQYTLKKDKKDNFSICVKYKKNKKVEKFSIENKDELRMFQYFLLFYDFNLLNFKENLWEDEEENGKIVKDKKIIEKKLVIKEDIVVNFSPTAFVINILQKSKVIESFLNRLYCVLYKEEGLYENSKILKEISILSELEEWNELLLPLDNIEYIIYLGEQLQERNKIRADKPSVVIKNYFEYLAIELKKYNPVIEEKFKSFLLVDSVCGEKRELMDMLDNNLQDYLDDYSNVEVIMKDLTDNYRMDN